MRNTFPLMMLCAFFLISTIVFPGCTGTSGDIRNVRHPDNDQGFANPADLWRALPVDFDDFRSDGVPYLSYHLEDDDTTIRSSGLFQHYTGPNDTPLLVGLSDYGQKRDPPDGEWLKVNKPEIQGCDIYRDVIEGGNLKIRYQVNFGSLGMRIGAKEEDVILRYLELVDFEALEALAKE